MPLHTQTAIFMICLVYLLLHGAIWFALSDRNESQKTYFDWTGFLALSTAIACVQLVLARGQRLDWFEAPEIMLEARLAILAYQLLEAARPAQLQAWRLVTLPDLGRPDDKPGFPFGEYVIGLTGKQSGDAKWRPIAWRVSVVDAKGKFLASKHSFLWGTPSDLARR